MEGYPMFANITWGRMTRASLALTVAISGSAVLLASAANAAPLALAKSAITQVDDSDVTLVRDGCGRGMRYSNRRGGCVPIDGGGPGPDPAAAIIGGVINQAIGSGRPRGCGRGMRWSDRRGGCVPY